MNTVHRDCVGILLSALTALFSMVLGLHSVSSNQSLEGPVASLCGSEELMSTVLTSSLISHAAGNKNGISINHEAQCM